MKHYSMVSQTSRKREVLTAHAKNLHICANYAGTNCANFVLLHIPKHSTAVFIVKMKTMLADEAVLILGFLRAKFA